MSVFKHQITASMAKDIAFSLGVEPSDEEAEVFYQHLKNIQELYQHLKNVQELYHAQEKRLFTIVKRIKGPAFDKYAHSPSQAIDVLESAIFGENEEPSRAAMQSFGNSEQLNFPVIPDGYALVPVNPTDEMVAAAEYETGTDAQYSVDIWNSMCRAAMPQGEYRDLSQPVDPQISEYEKIMLQAGIKDKG
ncbi:hypothetical protein GQC79_004493 [Salmonella enterica]|nr:hypothetical protein [Salmonella enterica]